jgi:hypothetical protein
MLVMNNIRIILLLFSLTIHGQELEHFDTLKVAEHQPSTIELKTYLVKNQVPLNRSVEFHMELSWIGDMSRYQIIRIPQPVLTNLVMEGSGSANRLEELGEGMYRSTKSITYKFSPVTMGMAYVDGLEVKYRDQKTGEIDVLYSQRVSVEIIEPLPDDSGSGFQAFIYIVLLVIFFGAVFYFLVLFFRRRKQAREVSEVENSLAEQYLKKLSHDVDPKGTNLKEMTVQLSKLFREYLSKEYNIPTREASTKELVHYLQTAGIEEAELKRLNDLFEKLDLVKFAGSELDPAEFSNMYGMVENFLYECKKTWDAEKAQTKEE